MKTKLKILKLIVKTSLVLLVFTFTNCKDDCPGRPAGGQLIYEFHVEDSLKIPYTGYDTLTFLRTVDSTAKDTVVFIGRGKKYYKEWLRYENEESDCEYSVWAKGYTIDYVAQNEPDLKFSFKHQAQETEGGEVYIDIKGVEFFFILWRWDSASGYFEQLELNSNVYRKLRGISYMYNHVYRIFYNFDYGVLRIEIENETFDVITK